MPTISDETLDEVERELADAIERIDMAYGDPHEEENPHRYSMQLRAALSRLREERKK